MVHPTEQPLNNPTADNHFRRVVYGIGPYIGDYPEQVLVAGIVNGWCPMYVTPLMSTSTVLLHQYSCDADPTDLDSTHAELRTPEKTAALLRTKSVDELWYQHGLIHDFYVRRMHV